MAHRSSDAAGTRKLFKMMLGTDSEFVNKFYAARKYWDINVGQWTASGQTHTPGAFITMLCCTLPVVSQFATQLGCEHSVLDQAG